MTSATLFDSDEVTPDVNGLIFEVNSEELQALGETCTDAKSRAYCPYSLFRVGASLLFHQSVEPTPSPAAQSYPKTHILTGANVENASYPVGTCAERVALGTAVHMGYRMGSIKAIGVATDIDEFASPCGMCRQFIREFVKLSTPIFMFNDKGKFIVRTMGELLPLSFGPDVLPPRETLRKAREGGA